MRIVSLSTVTVIAGLLLVSACSGGSKDKTENATSTTSTTTSTTAATPTAPTPKAGLWEMKASSMGMSMPAMKVCVGEAKPGENPFTQKPQGANCAKNEVTASAGGYAIDSECTVNGMTAATKGTVSGDFSSAYKVELTTKMSGPNIPAAAQKEVQSVMEAKYVGPCPAGMKPNQSKPG
jgi:hypothetical protein